MDSIIGHSVANALTPAQQQKHHQRVLCLDGGGMKVKRSLLFILKKKGSGCVVYHDIRFQPRTWSLKNYVLETLLYCY